MKKYKSYSSIGIKDKFILCFNITSNDELTQHDVYLYGKVISPVNELVAGDVGENIQRKMYEQITPNSHITSDHYTNIVETIVRDEGVRLMRML